MTALDPAALSAADSAKASRQRSRPSSRRTSGLVPSGDFALSREQQQRPSACLPQAVWEAQLQCASALLAFTKLHPRYFCCTFPEPLPQGLHTWERCRSVVLRWRVYSICSSRWFCSRRGQRGQWLSRQGFLLPFKARKNKLGSGSAGPGQPLCLLPCRCRCREFQGAASPLIPQPPSCLAEMVPATVPCVSGARGQPGLAGGLGDPWKYFGFPLVKHRVLAALPGAAPGQSGGPVGTSLCPPVNPLTANLLN